MTVAMVSLGCPKNLVDSEKMLAHLATGGLVVGAPMDDADVIVVNTCGFLSAARDESLEMIRQALACKSAGRTKRVVVAGCLVNRDGRKLRQSAPGIDAVVGVNDRQAILDAVTGRGPDSRISAYAGGLADDTGRLRLTGRHTAYLRISEGCSRTCSFCTIPAIRGPFRSKPLERLLIEARELIADGAAELNIIGQDTTGYGTDSGGGASLASLLRALDGLAGVEWLRLLYAYPWGFTDELFDAIGGCRRVIPYVDMPLQHVADSVLERMRRSIRRKDIERLLERLRRIDGMVIRTTFIAGFPGETEAEFAELLAFVGDFGFDAMGVFEFSPEEGTPAAEMPHQVRPPVKAARAEALMLAQQELAFAANESVVDSPITVLVDGLDDQGRCVGRYYGQAPAIDGLCCLTEPRQPGRFIDGRVIDWDAYDLIVSPGRVHDKS